MLCHVMKTGLHGDLSKTSSMGLLPASLYFGLLKTTVNERKLSRRSLSQPCARDKRRIESLGKQFNTITRDLLLFSFHTKLLIFIIPICRLWW